VLTRTVTIACTPWQPVAVKPKMSDQYQCPFCGRYVTLSLFNGLRVHGPREARCKGSHYTPTYNQGSPNACPGAGRVWMGGTNSPICPVCHRGWRSLGLTRRPQLGHATTPVPNHERH
jgi:hypothetical protein